MIREGYKRLGDYIEPIDERNTSLQVKLSQGICNNKYFITPRQVAENSANDKIVRTGHFAYNRATTRNGDKISIAYREGPDCTVSSAYQIFRIKDENLLNPYYLWMWFRRPEFDRYARFKSRGSAHEFFEWDEMCDVYLPLPDIDTQRRIVAEYQAVESRIAANEQLIESLENTAQSIYKKMFVDDIDLGNLPDGWRIGTLEDLGEIVSGATPSTEMPEYWDDNGIAWLSPADLSHDKTLFMRRGAKSISKLGYQSASTRLLPIGTVLFSSRAPIGLMAISASELCTNQGFKSIVPKSEVGTEYTFYVLSNLKDRIANENTGATFAEVSGSSLKMYEAVIPS
ncbi:MAG: restriction endonuclease subunit S, partial [Prevotella sp.]|nr:restriction endonuclease subunit S [Prevotella sp.]